MVKKSWSTELQSLWTYAEYCSGADTRYISPTPDCLRDLSHYIKRVCYTNSKRTVLSKHWCLLKPMQMDEEVGYMNTTESTSAKPAPAASTESWYVCNQNQVRNLLVRNTTRRTTIINRFHRGRLKAYCWCSICWSCSIEEYDAFILSPSHHLHRVIRRV